MGIGTSLGAYFETNLDHHAGNEYLTNPNSTPDNNELSTNEVMPKPDEEPRTIPIADFTPLTDKQHDALMWDTPVVSSKDPDLREGTKQQHIDYMNGMLNTTAEEHKRNFEATAKAVGRENLLGEPFPAGRIRGWSDIPAFKDYKDNLPDDVEVHDMKDGTWTFKKKPAAMDTPMSELQSLIVPVANITNTPGEILEGLEGTRVFGSGYGTRGGPTAQMRRGANENQELYNARDKNMIGSKAVDVEIQQQWQAMSHRHERGNEIINKQKSLMDILDKRPWSDLERFKYKQLDKEHELLFSPDNYLS